MPTYWVRNAQRTREQTGYVETYIVTSAATGDFGGKQSAGGNWKEGTAFGRKGAQLVILAAHSTKAAEPEGRRSGGREEESEVEKEDWLRNSS